MHARYSLELPIVGQSLPVEAAGLGRIRRQVARWRGTVALPRILAAVHHAVPLRVEVVLSLRNRLFNKGILCPRYSAFQVQMLLETF